MEVKVGYARVDITPEDSVPLAGLGNTLKRMSEVVLDRLQATCLAFTDAENNTALLYTSDLICSIPAIVAQARENISKACGVAPDHIMFAGTHTHSATDYRQDGHPAIQKATRMLLDKYLEAAKLALADRKPATFSVGRSYPQTLNFVRHYTRDPETGALSGHPYEPDNQLQIVKITREGGKDIMIMNWQAHPCFTSGYQKHDMSADYIHSFRQQVEEERDMLFAFFLGASGDVNTRSRIKEEVIAPTREIYADMMRTYIDRALAELQSVDTGKVVAGEKLVELTNDHSDDPMVEDAQLVAKYWFRTYDRKATDAMAKLLGINSPYHANAIINRSKQGSATQMNIAAVSVGGLSFVFAPYEMFCKNGIFIKENSPKQVTLVATCGNGAFSYLADDFAFTEQCYEVDVRKFERGTAEKVAAAFVELLEEQNNVQ